jgi:hypothetical protein
MGQANHFFLTTLHIAEWKSYKNFVFELFFLRKNVTFANRANWKSYAFMLSGHINEKE